MELRIFFSMGESYIQLSNISEEPPKTFQIVQKLEFFYQPFAPGEITFASHPKSLPCPRGFPNLDKLETKARTPETSSNFVGMTFLGGFGVRVGVSFPCCAQIWEATSQYIGKKKKIGFSKILCLVGKIGLHNLNVNFYNF